MRTPTVKFLILCSLTVAGACAPIRYDVRVDAHDRGAMPPTARVMVVAATHTDPRLGPEVEGKIERLLKDRGFQVVQPRSDSDTVDLVVLAVFGNGEPTAGAGGTAVVQLSNLLPRVPRARAAQNRWLIVAVARPSALSGGSGVQAVPWLWYATTYADVANGSLAQVIDYLLVPTFEWWGRTTGSRISAPIEQYDPRVRVLINPPE
ncbi:MAG: hypothetical protein P8174_08690 [Gemmatimonadota bacterium]